MSSESIHDAVSEITADVWNRCLSADDATEQIIDLLEDHAASKAREALESAAAICDADAAAYADHIKRGESKAAALRCLCVAEGLADAIRAAIAKADGKS